MRCETCVHCETCFLHEVINDRSEHVKEYGCEDYINKHDHVEVVRCKNCLYCLKSDKTNRYFCTYHGKDMEVYLDDYCSCGVKIQKGKRNAPTMKGE